MTDRLDFEARLEERLRVRAGFASRPFDAAEIARQVVAADGRRRRIAWLEWPSTRPTLRWLVLALLLAIALVGAVAGVGALLRDGPPLPSSLASNGWIAVSANPENVGGGEFGDIYLVREQTAARRVIGSDRDGVGQACPRFSPDGQKLAYGEGQSVAVTTYRGMWPVAGRAVVVAGLNDEGDVSQIVRVPLPAGQGEIACPEWSPDGGQVAFRVGSELWVTDATSGQTTVFQVFGASWGQGAFEWSRDGSRIAVSELHQIRVVPMDDSASTLIPVKGATPGSLGWTAGDDRIIYISTDDSGDGLAINVVDPDGRNDTQIRPDPADAAAVVEAAGSPELPGLQLRFDDAVASPDGTRVAHVRQAYRCMNGGCTPDPERLLITDLDGSNVVELPIPPDFGVSGLQWSPDGKRLLFGWIAGVVSVALAPGSPAIVHSKQELNLEWSGSEVTWQPVFR